MLKKLLSNSFISIILLLLTLILGICRNYVWMTFRTGTGEKNIQKFNFLSTTILGYGLYFPLIVIIILPILLEMQMLNIGIVYMHALLICNLILSFVEIT